jgi:hypothetical protein
MTKIIIHGGPVETFQHIYTYVDGEKVDTLGVRIDELAEVALELVTKYNITDIDLAGARYFMEGIESLIKEEAVKQYSLESLNFRYV